MENDLLSIYGARVSANGRYLNLTLVRGEGGEKVFYHSCIKLNDIEARTNATIDITNNKAIIEVPMLKENKKPAETKDDLFAKADDLPF